MCDTMVVVPEDGPVWFAKNADREASEAQFLECHDGDSLTTDAPVGLPRAEGDARVLVSRPAWMWGCEMGVNEHGLAIGNEAVNTKMPVPKTGYSGMDFQTIALTTCRTADDALEQIIELTERFVQGGPMGYRLQRWFRYHGSFLIADATTGWILETAGHYWAAKRVRGLATISNALTIESDFDRIHDHAYGFAKSRGWANAGGDFSFAGAFSDRLKTALSRARVRRACTRRSLSGIREHELRHFIRALTDHGEIEPGRSLRQEAPCAHASWMPPMWVAQTTASLIARLDETSPTVWATGTSSPCLSVFKPAPFDAGLFSRRPIADSRFDPDELWWAHERLHRACLQDYHRRRITFAEDRERFQDRCLQPTADAASAWQEHRPRIDDWLEQALAEKAARLPLFTRLYWSEQSRHAALPTT